MESIWKKEVQLPKRERLMQDGKADIVIIGAGMAGLLAANLLHQKGVDVMVLEANEIASGQTQNTTAKITSQHDLLYDKLINSFGKEKAYLYAKANQKAIKMYQKMIEEQNISCHYEIVPAYVYSLRNASKIEKEVEAAKKLGIEAEFTTNTTLPFKVKGAVKFNNQAHFNPMEFLETIIKPLKIYEHTKVKEIKGNQVITETGKVIAKTIIVAAHYPFINVPGYYFLRMHQERSYVLALENAAKLDGMYIDESNQGYSFRNYKDLLLLGGGGHRTGEHKYGGSYEKLRNAAKEYYPNNNEVCHWSAQDCMTLDQIPYIGLYSASTPNLYVTTGFKKWGMTTSMVSAMILRDLILGKKNPFEEVFTPQRFQMNASIKNFLNEGKHAVSGLVVEHFKIPNADLEHIHGGHGGTIDYKGHKVGVYKDMTGKVFMVSTKCTHLGCKLEWNPDELSWDCPCHGSRFDYKGNLLNNPALKDLDGK